jgi:hypothetical protein
MVKAEKPKAQPKAKFTDKEQSERFVETARRLGVEETGEAFERAFEKIIPPKNRDAHQKDTKTKFGRSDQ